MPSRRAFLACGSAAGLLLIRPKMFGQTTAEVNVLRMGAKGDGVKDDTLALQAAIDSIAAKGGGRVVLPGKYKFLTGALRLKSNVDFHLADDAVLLAHTDEAVYSGVPGLLNSDGTHGFRITGTGSMDGQAHAFMTTYDNTDERWEPKKFRPRMFSLINSSDFEVREITFGHSPNWGLHMLGCQHVLVDHVTIRNEMDVPNCDGIDPDRCRDVEISHCDIVSADDAIVIKTSRQNIEYGPSENIRVHDCVVMSRDSGLKVGTETFGDISKVLFERCKIHSSGRGPTITHRQRGNIEDIEFRDIELRTEHHAARWWGWGEAASITAWPRVADGQVGRLRNVKLRNIKGTAENSFRIDGQPSQPIEDVLLENVDITIDQWTQYPGEHFDNRPVAPDREGLELHKTPVFSLRHVKGASLKNCTARWGKRRRPYFGDALEEVDVTGLSLVNFKDEVIAGRS